MNASFIVSYSGGYLSLLGLVQRPDIFKVRIISCFNWTIWTNVKIFSIFSAVLLLNLIKFLLDSCIYLLGTVNRFLSFFFSDDSDVEIHRGYFYLRKKQNPAVSLHSLFCR